MILTEITTHTEIGQFQVENNEVTDNDSSMLYIIIGAVAGFILLIIIAIIIWILIAKNKEGTTSSAIEMNEETVLQIPDSNPINVTNDNPLWTTSVMGETDDPFKNDFEEDNMEGFFMAKDYDI